MSKTQPESFRTPALYLPTQSREAYGENANYQSVSLVPGLAIFLLSFMCEARDLSSTPNLYCPEGISYYHGLSDISEYYQPNALHPMIQQLLRRKLIQVESNFDAGSQYVHSNTRLVTDSKRRLKGLLCDYTNKVDNLKTTLTLSFGTDLPFRIAGKPSKNLSANTVFCIPSWNATTNREECSKRVILKPEFHILVNELDQFVAHSIPLILAIPGQEPMTMASNKSYAIAPEDSFSIYITANGITELQQVCSAQSLGKETLKHPELIAVRGSISDSGAYWIYCQVASNFSQDHQHEPEANQHSGWTIFSDYVIPRAETPFQWIDESFLEWLFPTKWSQKKDHSYQTEYIFDNNGQYNHPGRDGFHQYWFWFQNNRQPEYSGKDDLAAAYKTLGLSPDSSKKAVKKKYRKLAKESHPDRGGNEEAFQRYAQAYELIQQSWK